MGAKRGNLSIDSDNIFPIIKKWLYSDHDIFYREMISNGCDAITKLKKLEVIGEYEFPEKYSAKIEVVVNPEEKTLKFIDNGLGMTADEVEEYITKIAFSGAQEFLEKYKDKTSDDQIIGHFGLGFYSAFMVADEVSIDTLSYQKDAVPVHWSCDGGVEYVMEDGDRKEVGTEITLYLNEDSLEFANEYRAREVIEKYCSFMPVEIFLTKANAEQEYETIDASELTEDDVVVERIHEEAKTEERENEDGEKETVEISPARDKVKINKRPVSLSDTTPLWMKHPNDCTDEEYREFYRKVFNDYKEPLFWIHLNTDYPFNLKGILYFPRINTEYESIEGKIKLYNNQVFIADNIKEVIPEYLMLLKGVIDCPDLPLNVSRSALQNDGSVKKISEYISKKVSDKLTGMYKTDKERYEKNWDDVSPFIKFGCLKDGKFSDRMMDYVLFKNIDGKYLTIDELVEEAKQAKAPEDEAPETEDETIIEEVTDEEAEAAAAGDTAKVVEEEVSGETVEEDGSDEVVEEDADGEDEEEKEPEKVTLFYVTDEAQQSQYINMFRKQGMDAVVLKHNIDTPFISHVENKREDLAFQRIDADLTDSLKDEEAEDYSEMQTKLEEQFRRVTGKEKLKVQVEKLKDDAVSAMMTLSEESRRMQDMMKMYGMDPNLYGGEETLVLNAGHPLVQYVQEHGEEENSELICEQLYDMAMLSYKQLSSEELTKFIERSNRIMMMLTK